MSKEVLERLKKTRTTYKEMIEFCCDNLVMNNYIIQELSAKGFYFDIENGTDYDEEEDYYYDVYQYFIIDDRDAERLKEYTRETLKPYYTDEEIEKTVNSYISVVRPGVVLAESNAGKIEIYL